MRNLGDHGFSGGSEGAERSSCEVEVIHSLGPEVRNSQPVDRGFPQTAWFVENSGVGVSQRHSRFDLRKLNPYLLCAYVGIRPCRGAEKPDLRP